MSYFPSFKMRSIFAFVLTAIFCIGSINANAQFLPEAKQNTGAIDPLLNNSRFFRLENSNQLKNPVAQDIFSNQKPDVSPSAGELDASLNVNIDSYPGNVRATVLQPDGKILVAGYFKTVNGVRNKNIVRLNADYSLDSTFSANVNGTIFAAALQADGKIIIGGSFLVVGNANRSRIARLNADGSLDTTFNPGTGADNLVYDVAVQPDGKILVGGNFYTINSTSSYGVARLNSDGSVDSSFASPIPTPIPSPNPPFQTPGIVYSLAVQPDGKILIAGYIVSRYNGTTAVASAVARLNPNGAFDSSFNPGTINSNAVKVALQADGKIVLAGFFTTVNGVNRSYIARFNADGSLDGSFNIGTGASRPVSTIYIQPDGKILIAGLFSSFNGVLRAGLARLNADGSLDNAFVPSSGFLLGGVQSILSLPSGKVLIGGSFVGGSFNLVNDSIKVFNSDGSSDSPVSFETTAPGGVRAIAVQPDGKFLVGGSFTRPRSGSITQLFRLKTDGSLDETFAPSSTTFSSSANGQINSIIVQPDGKILIAGLNIGVPGGSGLLSITSLARLNSDGTADTSFELGNVQTSSGIEAAALQPDGKIVVVWGSSRSIGIPIGGVARLNADGSLDSSFNLSVPAALFNSVVVQADGKILVGGAFSIGYVNSQTGNISYNGVIRLNADGSRDTTFVPATASNFENNRVTQVFALALQPDGKILVGGSIFTGNATTPTGAARLNRDGTLDSTFNSGAISSVADIARVEDIFLLPNGKILIGGLFNNIGATERTNIARLNADGTTDNAFNANTDNAVYEIVTQADGRVLIGGDFETANGVTRTALARLLSEPTARRTPFDFDGDGKADVSTFRPSNGTWYLLNSQIGFTAAQFGTSSDRLVPADYDGDGKMDLAVYRSGVWYLQRSSAGFTGVSFGDGGDVPQPADFDGDGKAELAVFRPSNGGWYVYNLVTNQTTTVQFGQAGDKPIVADYDGDGKADYAVYRSGTWYLQRSQAGFTGVQFGDANDKPVPADYDGDGKVDVAVFRPSSGTWYLNRSSQGFTGIAFGNGTDLPTPADYDGDGKADVAVFRSGTWYLQRSAQGFTGVSFGASSDKPIPNVFVP